MLIAMPFLLIKGTASCVSIPGVNYLSTPHLISISHPICCQNHAPSVVNITPYLSATSCPKFCQYYAPSLVNIMLHLLSTLRPISCQYCAPSLVNITPHLLSTSCPSLINIMPHLLSTSHPISQHYAPSLVHKPHLSSMSSPLLYGDSFFIGLTTHAKYHVSIVYTSVWAGFWEIL